LLNQRQWFSIIYSELLLGTASFGGMKHTQKNGRTFVQVC